MESIESVVVGAGVIGLSIARRLALAGREVLLLEAEETFGSGITSRNSEVIHAGIYYPRDSVRARMCVAGRDALYRFCERRGVAFKRIGKLIVATREDEIDTLKGLQQKAAANGVDDLRWIDGPTARRMEPAGNFVAALLSPSTGIIDSHGLILALLGEAEAAGVLLACRSPLEGAEAAEDGLVLRIGGAEPMALRCRQLVNAAGLGAPALAGRIAGLPQAFVPASYLAKGNYFALAGRSPFSHLIYPVPVPGGLGTHLTMDLGGQARFGPDVEWIERVDYDVDPARVASFYPAVRRFWPDLADGALHPDYAGIRPKLHGPGQTAADFVIQGPPDHGVAGLVNLFGIESPGLTSALAIADQVARLLGINAPAD